jgi:hypothetical protein
VLPGAIYAWWRHKGAQLVCRGCGSPLIVPEDSPEARQLLASVPDLPAQALSRHERASRAVAAIPFAAGVGVVVLFALSLLFPGLRQHDWFLVAVYAVAIAILAHPLWAVAHLVIRLAGRMRSRP